MTTILRLFRDNPSDAAKRAGIATAAQELSRYAHGFERQAEVWAVFHRSGQAFDSSGEVGTQEQLARYTTWFRERLAHALCTELPTLNPTMTAREVADIATAMFTREEAMRVRVACGGDVSAFDPWLHEFNPCAADDDGVTHMTDDGDWLVLVRYFE